MFSRVDLEELKKDRFANLSKIDEELSGQASSQLSKSNGRNSSAFSKISSANDENNNEEWEEIKERGGAAY